ncbi:MAG: tyrosinase family protein [Gammaproteobacteria bacterium]|nr:tyrosinase family protein [Gammaproteobacteria bacterium]MDH5801963.1 tyrosinase family protein [Gammaproteobacteria bacterium]
MPHYTRREFLAISSAAVAGMTLPSLGNMAMAASKPRYTRYSVGSKEGKRMLQSYKKGIRAMLKLPAEDPRNWFRYAFIHFMDCPHGNWWFYVWHRGYIGYLEQIIRDLSKDKNFALPYWDWTEMPRIPPGMFEDVLTPTNNAFATYTKNLKLFTDFIKPALMTYWTTLTDSQLKQQTERGYNTFEDLWNSVIGFDPGSGQYLASNLSYTNTCGARYLSKDNPKLDSKTANAVSAQTVLSGLLPVEFYTDDATTSFNSTKTTSHTVQPDSKTFFSILEGQPHNKVHNNIGGVGAIDFGPYGNMTNFLSPVDPVFFLHHSNMDRLWDIWTRKQQNRQLPYLPTGADETLYMNELFQFYVNKSGKHVGTKKASDYINTRVFDYAYAPGFGEQVIGKPLRLAAKEKSLTSHHTANVSKNSATVEIPAQLLKSHTDKKQHKPLVLEIMLPHSAGQTVREYDVLVNAPADVKRVSADSPYYGGTIAFFGPRMSGMKMSDTVSFHIALPKNLPALVQANPGDTLKLEIRVVPAYGDPDHVPELKGVVVKGFK